MPRDHLPILSRPVPQGAHRVVLKGEPTRHARYASHASHLKMYFYKNLFPHGNIWKMLYFVIVPQLENAYRITVVTRRCITAADIYWKSLGQTNYSPLFGWIFLSLAVSLPGVFLLFFFLRNQSFYSFSIFVVGIEHPCRLFLLRLFPLSTLEHFAALMMHIRSCIIKTSFDN